MRQKNFFCFTTVIVACGNPDNNSKTKYIGHKYRKTGRKGIPFKSSKPDYYIKTEENGKKNFLCHDKVIVPDIKTNFSVYLGKSLDVAEQNENFKLDLENVGDIDLDRLCKAVEENSKRRNFTDILEHKFGGFKLEKGRPGNIKMGFGENFTERPCDAGTLRRLAQLCDKTKGHILDKNSKFDLKIEKINFENATLTVKFNENFVVDNIPFDKSFQNYIPALKLEGKRDQLVFISGGDEIGKIRFDDANNFLNDLQKFKIFVETYNFPGRKDDYNFYFSFCDDTKIKINNTDSLPLLDECLTNAEQWAECFNILRDLNLLKVKYRDINGKEKIDAYFTLKEDNGKFNFCENSHDAGNVHGGLLLENSLRIPKGFVNKNAY